MFEKILNITKIFLQYKLLRYGILFLMLCLGLLILKADKVNIFGLKIEQSGSSNLILNKLE